MGAGEWKIPIPEVRGHHEHRKGPAVEDDVGEGDPRPAASLMVVTIPVNARLAPIIQSDCVRVTAAVC